MGPGYPRAGPARPGFQLPPLSRGPSGWMVPYAPPGAGLARYEQRPRRFPVSPMRAAWPSPGFRSYRDYPMVGVPFMRTAGWRRPGYAFMPGYRVGPSRGRGDVPASSWGPGQWAQLYGSPPLPSWRPMPFPAYAYRPLPLLRLTAAQARHPWPPRRAQARTPGDYRPRLARPFGPIWDGAPAGALPGGLAPRSWPVPPMFASTLAQGQWLWHMSTPGVYRFRPWRDGQEPWVIRLSGPPAPSVRAVRGPAVSVRDGFGPARPHVPPIVAHLSDRRAAAPPGPDRFGLASAPRHSAGAGRSARAPAGALWGAPRRSHPWAALAQQTRDAGTRKPARLHERHRGAPAATMPGPSGPGLMALAPPAASAPVRERHSGGSAAFLHPAAHAG